MSPLVLSSQCGGRTVSQVAVWGGALIEQAGSAMREVVFSVQRITDPMAEIGAASGELSAGIEQLIKAI